MKKTTRLAALALAVLLALSLAACGSKDDTQPQKTFPPARWTAAPTPTSISASP